MSDDSLYIARNARIASTVLAIAIPSAVRLSVCPSVRERETGFPNSHQLKSYVAFGSRLKLAARAVLSADAGLLVVVLTQ